MSRRDKLMARFLSRPKDFEYSELVAVFRYYGYYEDNGGATSGSKVQFVNKDSKSVFSIHKPHPGKIVKGYAIDLAIAHLKEEGKL